jgi:hypothetical protein
MPDVKLTFGVLKSVFVRTAKEDWIFKTKWTFCNETSKSVITQGCFAIIPLYLFWF